MSGKKKINGKRNLRFDVPSRYVLKWHSITVS